MKTILFLSIGLISIFGMIGVSFAFSAAPCVQASTIDINFGITALRVRKSPVTGDVLTTLKTQTGLKVLAVDPVTCWYKINTPQGEGWITNSETYVTVATTITPTPSRTATNTPPPTPMFTPTRILHQSIYCLKNTIEMTPVANLIRVECQIP